MRTHHLLFATLCAISCDGGAIAHSDTTREVFAELRCGESSVCAMTDEGRVVCWGGETASLPFSGELPSSPIQFDIQTALCVLDSGGDLHCGSPANQLFDGGLTTFSLGAADSSDGACALKEDGTVRCSPFRCTDVTLPSTSFLDVGRNSLAACGLDAGGDLTCWADFPGSGCEYDADTCSCQGSVPTVVARGIAILAGGGTCGLTFAGEISCPWLPEVASSSHKFVYVDDNLLVCGVRDDGTGECLTSRGIPDLEAVPDGPLTQICSGVYGICGLLATGEVVCSGIASEYQVLPLGQ